MTHANPDLDAVCAVWLIKRFWNGWEKAETIFVPAGETLESYRKKAADAYLYEGDLDEAEIVHVDTGMGMFDHHQAHSDTCAAKIIFGSLVDAQENGTGQYNSDILIQPRHFNKEVLQRLTDEVNDIDHFRQVYYPDATADRHQFMLVDILDGLNLLYNNQGSGDVQVVAHGCTSLDAIYRVLQNKAGAEQEIEGSDKIEIITSYGRAVGFETGNDAVLDIAQKQGFCIAVRKDKHKGYVRIKSLPDKQIDLTPVYTKLKRMDTKATWFLHASHAMLLNGSTKNPNMRPSVLTLADIMGVLEEAFPRA